MSTIQQSGELAINSTPTTDAQSLPPGKEDDSTLPGKEISCLSFKPLFFVVMYRFFYDEVFSAIKLDSSSKGKLITY